MNTTDLAQGLFRKLSELSDAIYRIKLVLLDSKVSRMFLSYFDQEFARSRVCSHAIKSP